MVQSARGIEAPSTTEPLGACQTFSDGSVKEKSCRTLICRSGVPSCVSQVASGSPENSPCFIVSPYSAVSLTQCGRTATEADDVAVGVLDIEVLRAPRRGRERLEDRYTVGDALLIERFDPIDGASCLRRVT